jgi:hypothetical protein
MISIKCSNCGKGYQLRDEYAGKRVKCKCGQAMVVPRPEEPAEPILSAGAGGLSGLLDESLPPLAQGSPLDDPFAAASSAAAGPTPGPTLGRTVLPPKRTAAKKSGLSPAVIAAIAGGGVLVVLFAGLAIFFLTRPRGPGGTTAEKQAGGTQAPVQSGFATPQEAFEAQKKARLAKDWAAELRTWSPESQDRQVASAALLGTMMAASEPEIAAVLQRHGVDSSLWKDESPQPGAVNFAQIAAKIRERRDKLAGVIQDKPAFYAEMMTQIQAMGKKWADKMPASLSSMQAEAEQAQASAQLVDLEVAEDTAKGKQSLTFRGKTLALPIYFRKIDGRWYVHQPDISELTQPAPANAPASGSANE